MSQQIAEKVEQELDRIDQLSENLFDLWVINGSVYEDELMQIRNDVLTANRKLLEFYETVKPEEETNKTEVPLI